MATYGNTANAKPVTMANAVMAAKDECTGKDGIGLGVLRRDAEDEQRDEQVNEPLRCAEVVAREWLVLHGLSPGFSCKGGRGANLAPATRSAPEKA